MSYGVSSEFSDHSFYGGDAFADVTFAGEKAKAKRIATKSAPSESKDQSGKSTTTPAATPIAYVSHNYFGNSNSLPGKLTVGQLNWKLMAAGELGDSLRLNIRYGLPAGKSNFYMVL